jgi:hypothetical protein
MAISGTVPPLSTEIIMSMGTFTGVTINKVVEAKAGLNVTAGDVVATNNVTAAKFLSNTARFYYNNYGSYNTGILSHPTGLQFALSNSTPPSSTELYMAMDSVLGITISKYTEVKAGLYVSGGDLSVSNNIYAYGDFYGQATKTFYSPNLANPALWDKRLVLGHTTNDGIKLYCGTFGTTIYQHANDGGNAITQFNSTDKRLRHFGNITTETGGSVSASTFTTLSDERVKTDIVNADLTECERLVKTISPKGYERTDYASGRKFGYIAQDWHNQISNDFNCVVSDYDDSDSNGENQRTLYAIDILPIVATIHGALKVALNKIELLERRAALLEGV